MSTVESQNSWFLYLLKFWSIMKNGKTL